MIEPTDEMVTAAAEVAEDEMIRRLGRDLGTIHRDDIIRAILAAAFALVDRDYSLRPATCDVMQENDWAVICELPRGHKGTHSATVEKAVSW